MSRAKTILAEIMQFAKYDPGKPIKNTDNKDIPGATALATNTSVCFDPDPQFGGHFITRYGLNDTIDTFRITHEEAANLVTHIKKNGLKSQKKISGNGKTNDIPNGSTGS